MPVQRIMNGIHNMLCVIHHWQIKWYKVHIFLIYVNFIDYGNVRVSVLYAHHANPHRVQSSAKNCTIDCVRVFVESFFHDTVILAFN